MDYPVAPAEAAVAAFAEERETLRSEPILIDGKLTASRILLLEVAYGG